MEREIKEGMAVRSSDGQKLGKVISCGDDQFVIEKGFFFPKDYIARYDEATVKDGEVQLSLPASSLRKPGDDTDVRSREASAGGLGTQMGTYASDTSGRPMSEERGAGESRLAHGATEDVRIPVAEEELVAEKHEREAGDVRVRKDVVTEHRQIDVPVTREEVHVERTPVQGGEARGGEARFEKDEIRVPVREEEVEIRKRPVVKEEVRVSKTARREERRAEGDVRREDVKIDKEGDVDTAGSGIGEPEK